VRYLRFSLQRYDKYWKQQKKGENINYDSRLYRMGVLKKYGVTQAEFDSSLVYYMRHADRLHKIYENISDRMSKEALSLGASESEISRYAQASGNDTTNIWTSKDHFLLIPYAPYNKYSFVLEADTSFYQGDKFLLSFNTNFVYQDGVRNGVAQLSVRFSNDSVTSRTLHVSSNMGYTIEVQNYDSLKIKEVRGFFYLGNDKNASTSTLKMMFVDHVRLIRFHPTKESSANRPTPPTNVPRPNLPVEPRVRNQQPVKLEAEPMNREMKPMDGAVPRKLERPNSTPVTRKP